MEAADVQILIAMAEQFHRVIKTNINTVAQQEILTQFHLNIFQPNQCRQEFIRVFKKFIYNLQKRLHSYTNVYAKCVTQHVYWLVYFDGYI